MTNSTDEEKKKTRENEKHKDRSIALDRALKMSYLFKIDHFEKIMTAVNQKNETDFTNYLKEGAQLSEVEAKWLWNYLKNYDESLYPYGAVTGW